MANTSYAAAIIDSLPALGETLNLTIGHGNFVAQSFSTTASDFVITDMTLRLKWSGATGGNTYKISIYSYDIANDEPDTELVGGVVFEAGPSNISGTYANVNFSGLNITLSPSTKYHVVLNNNTGQGMHWAFANDASITASSGFAGTFYSGSNDGSTWGTNEDVGNKPQILQVNAVPEPAHTALLFAAGAAGVAALRQRRKLKKAASKS